MYINRYFFTELYPAGGHLMALPRSDIAHEARLPVSHTHRAATQVHLLLPIVCSCTCTLRVRSCGGCLGVCGQASDSEAGPPIQGDLWQRVAVGPSATASSLLIHLLSQIDCLHLLSTLATTVHIKGNYP